MHDIRVRLEYEMTKYGSGASFGITPYHLHITLHIIISMEYSVIYNASSCPALLSTFVFLRAERAGLEARRRHYLHTAIAFPRIRIQFIFSEGKKGVNFHYQRRQTPQRFILVVPCSRRWRCRSRALKKPPKVQSTYNIQYTTSRTSCIMGNQAIIGAVRVAFISDPIKVYSNLV